MIDRKAVQRNLPRARLRSGGLAQLALRRSRAGRFLRRVRAGRLLAAALVAALVAVSALVAWPLRPIAWRPGSPVAEAPAAPPAREEAAREVAGDDLVLEPPYDSLDGLTIVQGPSRIRLAGLEGPSRNAICLAEDGRPWACGLQARAALHNLIGVKILVCRRRAQPVPGVLRADCTADGEDLAGLLVAGGWARPEGANPRLGPERDLAQRERRGLWDGNWTIRGGI